MKKHEDILKTKLVKQKFNAKLGDMQTTQFWGKQYCVRLFWDKNSLRYKNTNTEKYTHIFAL